MSNPSAVDPNAPPVAQGTILAGKYRVERVIGEGGMGVVVEARHIALDERVAMKFLTSGYASHPEASARFLREARAAVKIKSEHVARVSDVGTLENGAPYMVMEFLQGHDLSKELQTKGVLQLQDAVDYVIQACEAIAEAHAAGIVHRDLKPANLFLSKRMDGSALVKVLDFGISKMSDGVENLTKTMAAMGSALYMSPEQMQQTRGVDHRTDIYALGVALYELLAGKQPYYADTLPQLCAEVLTGTPAPIRIARPDLPPELAPVLEKAYARDRADRYSSIAHFVTALAPFAPSRSQQTLERITRTASLPVPIAGAPATPAVPPGGPLLAGGGTIALDVVSPLAGLPAGGGPNAVNPPTGPVRTHPSAPPPPAGYAGAPQQGYPAQPQATPAQGQQGYPAQGQQGYPPPGQQGYPAQGQQGYPQGPVATSSQPDLHANSFPGAPAATAPNMELATPARPAPAASKAPILIGGALAVIGIAAAAMFALRAGPDKPPPPSPAVVTQTATVPPAEVSATATATATSAAAPTATQTAPLPTASPTAAPTTSVAAKPVAGGGTKPTSGAPTTKPTGPKPSSIFDDR